MRASVQRSTKNSREAHTSQKRALLPRISLLTAVLLVVAILVAAAGGAALAALFSGNTPADLPTQVSDIGAPSDSSPEAGFARDMMVHHAQAVEMAEIVRDKTESEEIRTLATDIALTQQAQIGMMQGWLDVWGLSPTGTEPAMSWMGHPTEGPMPGMATPEEINRTMEAMSREHLVNFARIHLEPVGGSGVSGTATFEEVERGVRIDLDVEGLPKPGTTYLAHVHLGTCAAGEDSGHKLGEGGHQEEEGADH